MKNLVKKLLVCVTKEDISKGHGSSVSRCPIAVALRRYGFTHVTVDTDFLTMRGPLGFTKGRHKVKTPARAVSFIRAVDHISGDAVRPTRFSIPLA